MCLLLILMHKLHLVKHLNICNSCNFVVTWQGRTGVMICSYLLHNDHFKESKDALRYYGDARTRNAKGVTIPSQRRYVLYYNHLLRHKLTYTRTMVLVKRFEMSPIPTLQNSTCSKQFVLLNLNPFLWSHLYNGTASPWPCPRWQLKHKL